MLASLIGLFLAASPLNGPVGGGWMLSATPKGCSISMVGDSGSKVEFAIFASEPELVYMQVANPAWSSIVAQQSYPLQVSFGRKTITIGGAGHTAPNHYGLISKFTRLDWIDDSRKRDTIGIQFEGKTLWYSRTPPMSALLAINRCINGQMDPFAR